MVTSKSRVSAAVAAELSPLFNQNFQLVSTEGASNQRDVTPVSDNRMCTYQDVIGHAGVNRCTATPVASSHSVPRTPRRGH